MRLVAVVQRPSGIHDCVATRGAAPALAEQGTGRDPDLLDHQSAVDHRGRHRGRRIGGGTTGAPTGVLAVTAALLAAALLLQLRAIRHIPWLYWLTVVLASVLRTQASDAPGISFCLRTVVFAGLPAGMFARWCRCERTLSIHTIVTRRRALFYWAAILCTFALGTAAGDLASETLDPGLGESALLFGALVTCTVGIWVWGGPPTPMFWMAYILAHPLGAALGDLLAQGHRLGGLDLGACWTSALFLSVMASLVLLVHVTQDTDPAAPEAAE
jgi:uncharacterized membrane-anchored protein